MLLLLLLLSSYIIICAGIFMNGWSRRRAERKCCSVTDYIGNDMMARIRYTADMCTRSPGARSQEPGAAR
jgi:hypothetical protein